MGAHSHQCHSLKDMIRRRLYQSSLVCRTIRGRFLRGNHSKNSQCRVLRYLQSTPFPSMLSTTAVVLHTTRMLFLLLHQMVRIVCLKNENVCPIFYGVCKKNHSSSIFSLQPIILLMARARFILSLALPNLFIYMPSPISSYTFSLP